MKMILPLSVLLVFAGVAPRSTKAQQNSNSTPAGQPNTSFQNAPAASSQANDVHAEAYYDFTMGHYYESEYELNSRAEDANRAIDFYKKAYALDPDSEEIREQLAEIYFQSQHIRDAVTEAQALIQKDPNDLSARRLLARIYVRSLGDFNDASGQTDTIAHALEQYREILRLDPTDTDSALWLARLYRMQNDNADSEMVLRQLLMRDPDNENAVEQLTQLLLDEGKSQGAISQLQDLISHSPTAHLWDLLGNAYTQVNDLPKAEDAFRKSVEIEPDEVAHHHGLAQTLLSEEKYPEALAEYQVLTGMDEDDAENYLRLAEIYQQMHQLDKAEQNILIAKQRAPGSLEVIYYESSIYENEGRLDDAVHVLSDAVTAVKSQSEVTPSRRRTMAILYQQLGQLYREAGNYTAAVNTFHELLALGPEEDHRARGLIIETYRNARDLPKALEATKEALQAYPMDTALKIEQAFLYGDGGQIDQGATALHGLLKNTPADFEIQLDLAQLYQQGRRWPDAENAAHAAEKLASTPEEKETVAFVLGAVFERQKKYDQAEQEFRDVLQENPHNASALNYYGYMLADRGVRLDEATDLIKRALAEDPNNAAYLDSLGWAYFKANNIPEAEEWLRKAVSREGDDPTMLSHLGDVYAKDGKDSLAEAEWEKSLDEWRRSLPGDVEPDKMMDVEQKITDLKRRLAQGKTASDLKQ